MNLKPNYILATVFISFVGSLGFSQTLSSMHEFKSQPTVGAICDDVKPQPGKPVVIHGPYIISPDGVHKAYARVEVQLPDSEHRGEYDCRNHTTLFMAKGPNGRYDPILDVTGADNPTRGNGLQLIDWSADSETLLADLLTWYYDSEGAEHNFILYSSRTGSLTQKSLSEVFMSVSHEDCRFDGEIMGFLADGQIALRTVYVHDEIEEWNPCVKSTGFWAMNASNFRLTKISGRQVVKHNGHFEESK